MGEKSNSRRRRNGERGQERGGREEKRTTRFELGRLEGVDREGAVRARRASESDSLDVRTYSGVPRRLARRLVTVVGEPLLVSILLWQVETSWGRSRRPKSMSVPKSLL